MKRAFAVIVYLAIGALPARAADGTGVGDELLNLLDEAVAAVSEPNSLSSPEPSYESDTTSEPNEAPAAPEVQTAVIAEPNRLPNIPEPNTVEAHTAASAAEEADEPALLDESRRVRRAVLMGQIEPVETLSPEQQELNLNHLIRQLQSLEAPKTAAVQTGPDDSQLKTAAEQTASIAEQVSDDKGGSPAETEPQHEPDPNTAAEQMLERLEKSESVVNPLLLADALFRQGYQQQALKYYQQAVERSTDQESETLQWALFQMANCCVNTDPAKANDLYSQLLSRFPNCKWNGLAQSRRATLEWMMSESVQHYSRKGEHAQR